MTRRDLWGSAFAAPALLRARNAKPNVLWLMSDEHRPDSLGCYGSRWAHSPALDAIAREGVLFRSAYVPSPVCVPCRTAMLTGNAASTNGVLHNQARMRGDEHLLTWVFEDAGYQTASFGKKHYFFPGKRQAFQTEGGSATDDIVDAQSYASRYRPEDYDAVQYKGAQGQKEKRTWILAGRFPADESQTAEARNVSLAMNWLSRRDQSKPFLLRLSMNAPHTPVVVPPKYLDLIDPDKIKLPGDGVYEGRPQREAVHLSGFEGSQSLSSAEIRKIRHYYYARVAFLDDVLGRLLAWMKVRNLLSNTIVAFVSDHGTHLGDHGLLQKQTFYEQVATVPFFFWSPERIRNGVRLKTPVNTMSMLPSLAELAELKAPKTEAQSLADCLRTGHEPTPTPVFSEIAFGYQGYRDQDRQVMVRDRRYKMSRFLHPHATEPQSEPDGALYDLQRDPGETRNLFTDPAHRTIRIRMEQIIRDWDRGRHSA